MVKRVVVAVLLVAACGLAGCDRLLAEYGVLARCDKIPQESRDAMAQGLESMRQGWGDMSRMDADTRRATNDACLSAADAVQQSMTAIGCTP